MSTITSWSVGEPWLMELELDWRPFLTAQWTFTLSCSSDGNPQHNKQVYLWNAIRLPSGWRMYRVAVSISVQKGNVSLHVGYLGPGTGWPRKWGTACEYKKASFHVLFRKLSTVITAFCSTVVTCVTEQMLVNKSKWITARSKNVNC